MGYHHIGLNMEARGGGAGGGGGISCGGIGSWNGVSIFLDPNREDAQCIKVLIH